MKKNFLKATTLLLALYTFVLSACDSKPVIKDNLEDVLNNYNPNDYELDEDDYNGFYGYSAEIIEIPTEYNGGELIAGVEIFNNASPVDIGIALYVNGVQTEFKVNDGDEYVLSYALDYESAESKNFKMSFIPYNCKKGDKADISIVAMLAPSFKRDDAKNLGFGNFHSVATIGVPFTITINEDAPEKDIGGIYTEVSKTEITDEFREQCIERDPLNPSIITFDRIKQSTPLEMFIEDPLDPYFSCDDTLELTLRGYGQASKFMTAIYIDHEIVPAFDGEKYALFDIDEGENISYTTAKIDTSYLDEGVHHIYMLAIPVDDEDGLARKVITRLLLKGDEFINQAEEILSKQDEEENNKPTEPTEPTDKEQYVINLDTNSIGHISMLDENTLIAKCMGDIQLYDLKENKIIKKISLPEYYRKLQVIDNGFVLHSFYDIAVFDIYDKKGNLVKHVEGTADTYGADIFSGYHMVVSNDGKRVAYSNPSGIYTNSIDFDDEVPIQPYDVTQQKYGIGPEFLYKDDKVFCYAVDSEKGNNYFASYNETTKELTIYHKVEAEQQFTSQIHGNSFVVSDTTYDKIRISDKLYYYTFGDSEMRELTCEDPLDNRHAYISDGGKYILSVGEEYETKIYDTETNEVIWKNTYRNGIAGAYIDENARKVYIVAEVKIWVYEF